MNGILLAAMLAVISDDTIHVVRTDTLAALYGIDENMCVYYCGLEAFDVCAKAGGYSTDWYVSLDATPVCHHRCRVKWESSWHTVEYESACPETPKWINLVRN